jgi:hypothetical protein
MARISYDNFFGRYTLDYKGECILLTAKTFAAATAEVKAIIKNWRKS